MKRSLTLKSETLTELSTADLLAVNGGVPPTRLCPTAQVTCFPGLIVDKVTDIVTTIHP
jgi:hypothetical protein